MKAILKDSEIQKNSEFLKDEINGMYAQGDIATRMIYNISSLGVGSPLYNFDKADSEAAKYAKILGEHMSVEIAKDQDYKNLPMGSLKSYINSHKEGRPQSILIDIKTKAEVIKDLHEYFNVSKGLSESLPKYSDKMEVIDHETHGIFSKKLALEFLKASESMTLLDLADSFKNIDENKIQNINCERTLEQLVSLGKELKKIQ